MKYLIHWFERSQGSPLDYEHAQRRILEVFSQMKPPAKFKIELFVVRVGEWGGHLLVDKRRCAGGSQVLLDFACF
jgi:hypothetical protein